MTPCHPKEPQNRARLEAAIRHLESVHRVCMRQKQAKVLPFPPREK